MDIRRTSAAPHCNTRHCSATHCNTLQHIPTHYNTLRHTATHCNTLQHTATHCNTLCYFIALQYGYWVSDTPPIDHFVMREFVSGPPRYGVATIGRLFKITGVFCKRALWKRRDSAKETYDFKEPTNRSHPISLSYQGSVFRIGLFLDI